jgi:hypothetical protein
MLAIMARMSTVARMHTSTLVRIIVALAASVQIDRPRLITSPATIARSAGIKRKRRCLASLRPCWSS